jgi:hypothetical protein
LPAASSAKDRRGRGLLTDPSARSTRRTSSRRVGSRRVPQSRVACAAAAV